MKTTFAGIAAAAVLTSPVASACGGFFCSQVPVDQVGEQILFAVDGNNVTAHIQVAYQGDAESFSWVLPLPSVPTLGVGTDLLFTALRGVTDPRFFLTWESVSGCSGGDQCFPSPEAGGGDGVDAGDGGENGPVVVLVEGEVGPYDYKVVQSDSGDALFAWLNENGYDQPEASKPLVGHYVNQEFVFLALKLLKDKSAGDLQPVVVSYTSEEFACVPLKLTSIAAADDMPVTTWVLADSRAIPMNYFHVTLNAKAYPWLECASGYWWGGDTTKCSTAYTDMVSDAADQANGHAFVTEYAGTSSKMAEQLWSEGRYNLDALKSKTDPMAFLQEMLSQGFPRTSSTQDIIRKWIPKPASVPEDCDDDPEFYTWNMESCLQYMPDDYVFDATGFAADLDAKIVKPSEEAQRLFDLHPYLTRVYTQISPDEMTKDPIFSFNPDLGDVSNEHTATATPVCKPGESTASSVKLTYPDGTTETQEVTWESCSPPIVTGGADGESALGEIQSLAESGAPVAVDPSDVAAAEAQIELRTPTPGQSDRPANPGTDGDDGSGTFTPPTGTDGTDGADGADASLGADGVDGADGTAGSDGATGGGSGGGSGCTTGPRGSLASLFAAMFGLGLLLTRRKRA
ncbi:MAG: DUF2330 domain-containing protein [Myxococcales bacterium]|nr:DUF2330 domain-containing protein [Myxococcales bacterium]